MEQIKFFGATVISVDMTLGWNFDPSEVSIELVEDLRQGDSYSSGVLGSPYRLEVSGMVFDGILQSQERRNDFGGNPVYAVRLRSPNDFLDGQSLTLSNYTGDVGGMTNLMNLYGYWEDKWGFGGSLINELGMVWEAPNYDVVVATGAIISTGSFNGFYGIKPGIEELQSGYNSLFGNAFTYNGHTYKFDLSLITGVDVNWRFNGDGGSCKLLEVVDSVCNDAGYDYYLKLIAQTGTYGPHTLQIKTVDKKLKPELGKIQEYVNIKSGCSSKYYGQELNYEYTNLFLVGADKEVIFQQTDSSYILPFWGFDSDGIPITGSGINDDYEVTVPCPEISNIIGSSTYTMKVAELRCALSNQDIWGGYILKYKPALASSIALASCFSTDDGSINYRFAHDMVNQGAAFAEEFAAMNDSNKWTLIHKKIFDFVYNYANEFYGRRFMVKTPINLQFKYEPDTAVIKWDWEPIDSAYLENGANPLGLNAINQQYFEDNDRFVPMVKFNFSALPLYDSGADIPSFNSSYKVIQSNELYTTCRYMNEAGIFFIGSNSYIAIELPDVLRQIQPDMLGGVDDINTLFSISSSEWANVRNSSTAGKYFGAAIQPSSVAIPFRSNNQSYGPWFITGSAGKTEYRKEDGLAPWNYGGYYYMNLAASGILENFVRNSQVNENGTVQFPGYPDRNLGEQILDYGPNISHMNINLSNQGVTTTYQFRTYTQRANAFGKLRVDRMALLGTRQAKFGRKLLEMGRNIGNATNANIVNHPSYRYLDYASRAIRQESPHGTLVGFVSPLDNTGQVNLVSSQTYEESVANTAYTGIFKDAACVSMDGIFRPFAVSSSYDGNLPHQEDPSSTLGGALDRNSFDVWKDETDVDWFLFSNGSSYQGLHRRKNNSTPSTAKILGARMPIHGVGYGLDYFGQPTPNKSGECQTQFKSDLLDGAKINSSHHKAGPLLMHWDQKRKGWTIPTICKGVLVGDIEPNASGIMAIYYNGEVREDRIYVNNFLDATLDSGARAICSYDPWDNNWLVIATNCSPGSDTIGNVTFNINYDA